MSFRNPIFRSKEFVLCLAARAGDLPNTKDLLDLGVDPRSLCSAALNGACLHGHREIVRLLLDRGADPFDSSSLLCMAEEPWWGPATHWAARHDVHHHRFDMLRLLTSHGTCNPDALRYALDGLLRKGKNPRFADKVGRQMIDECVTNFGADRILHGLAARWVGYLVCHHKANLDARLPYGGEMMTPLERAVDRLEVGTVNALLAHGADPNAVPTRQGYLADPDQAQVPELAWAILRLLVNAPGSRWIMPAGRLAEIL